ncbi:MAG: GtrA family protein [Bombilactobacillus sp.]
MIPKLKQLYQTKKEIINYLIFGLLTTIVNYIVFFLLLLLFKQMPTVISNSIAWFISLLFAYFTNRRWVFQSQAKGLKATLIEFWWFLTARIFSLFIDNLIVYLGIDRWHQNESLVKLVSQILIVILNYLFSKWIFKSKKAAK